MYRSIYIQLYVLRPGQGIEVNPTSSFSQKIKRNKKVFFSFGRRPSNTNQHVEAMTKAILFLVTLVALLVRSSANDYRGGATASMMVRMDNGSCDQEPGQKDAVIKRLIRTALDEAGYPWQHGIYKDDTMTFYGNGRRGLRGGALNEAALGSPVFDETELSFNKEATEAICGEKAATPYDPDLVKINDIFANMNGKGCLEGATVSLCWYFDTNP